MVSMIKRTCRVSLISAFLLCALGIIMMAQPVTTLYLMIMFLGGILIIAGALHFYTYFSEKDKEKVFSFELALAIIDVILGAVCVASAPIMSVQFAILIGLIVAVQGVMNIQLFVNSRNLLIPNNNWVFASFLSILGIVLGVVLIFCPTNTMAALVRIGGIVLVITELINILDNLYLLFSIDDHQDKKKAKKAE